MLKFLTHKLRTHSLNEDAGEKVEERDSGTESDDEAERGDSGDFYADVIMKWNDVTDISMAGEACACAPTPPPRLLPDPEVDQMYDHHSSEEELEVINGTPSAAAAGAAAAGGGAGGGAGESRRRGASSPAAAAPGKRKWQHPATYDADLSPSEDLAKVETPVRFRTSPPLEALKPRRAGGAGGTSGASGASGGASGVMAAAEDRAPSPRRRRAPQPPRRHRPALDFDKMQQLKVGGVRSWRAVGGTGGELSVFCW